MKKIETAKIVLSLFILMLSSGAFTDETTPVSSAVTNPYVKMFEDSDIGGDWAVFLRNLDSNRLIPIEGEGAKAANDFHSFLESANLLVRNKSYGPKVLRNDFPVFFLVMTAGHQFDIIRRIAQKRMNGKIFSLFFEIGDQRLYIVKIEKSPFDFLYSLYTISERPLLDGNDFYGLDITKGERAFFIPSGKIPAMEFGFEYNNGKNRDTFMATDVCLQSARVFDDANESFGFLDYIRSANPLNPDYIKDRRIYLGLERTYPFKPDTAVGLISRIMDDFGGKNLELESDFFEFHANVTDETLLKEVKDLSLKFQLWSDEALGFGDSFCADAVILPSSAN